MADGLTRLQMDAAEGVVRLRQGWREFDRPRGQDGGILKAVRTPTQEFSQVVQQQDVVRGEAKAGAVEMLGPRGLSTLLAGRTQEEAGRRRGPGRGGTGPDAMKPPQVATEGP